MILYFVVFVLLLVACTIATTVDHNNEGLTSIPSVAGATTRLYLTNNKITTIVSGALDNLPNLIELRLNNNKMTSVGHIQAVGSTLKELYLSGNPLGSIPDGTFDGLDKLQKLTLHSCQLKVIPDLSDVGDTLLWLYIYNNKITSLDSESLAPLVALKLFFIDIREVETLKNVTLPALTNVRIYYASTGLTDFEIYTNTITKFDVHGKDLTKFPELTGYVEQITYFHLFSIKFSEISAEDLFPLTNLGTLNLQNCNGDTDIAFPGSPDELLPVYRVYIQNCNLQRFPDFNYLKNSLTHVYVFRNKITVISQNDLSGFAKLTYLHVAYNQLTTVAYVPTLKLTYLNLRENNFTRVPPIVKSLNGTLEIRTNDIKSISEREADYFTLVTSVFLLENFNLTYISDLNNLENHTLSIDIRDTGVNLCDCRNAWMLQKRENDEVKYDDTSCTNDNTQWSSVSNFGLDEMFGVCDLSEMTGRKET